MAKAWTECPDCGASMKTEALEAHRERVHGQGGPAMGAPLKRVVLITAVVLVAAGAVAAIVLLGEQPAPVFDDEAGGPSHGNAEAQLTVYLFADFKCPHCRTFEVAGAWEHLKETWIDPGDVRVEFKNLAFLGPDSVSAAEASHCVWEAAPQHYLTWRLMVFENQTRWTGVDGLVSLTAAWGETDADTLADCLEGGRHRALVDAEGQEATQAGVRSTPTLVVGSERLNANSIDAVDRAIAAELARLEAEE